MADDENSTPEDEQVTSDRALYAVYDTELQQFVSGVSSKSTTDKARSSLGKTGITKGHKLETRRV